MVGIVVLLLGAGAGAFWLLLKSRNIDIWFLAYLRQCFARRSGRGAVRHVYVCVADHYEPYFGDADRERAHALVERWTSAYRQMAEVLLYLSGKGRAPPRQRRPQAAAFVFLPGGGIRRLGARPGT